MDRLTELQTLLAVTEAGSLAGAARRLGRSAPAVTRILAELEARVGVTLVARTTRSCRPTEAGERLADQARRLLADYQEAVEAAGGAATAAKGTVRLTAPLVFGREHVAPRLSGFLDAHPEIALDLHLVDRVVDLDEEGFDLALRIGELTEGDLVARRLGEVRRMVVASPTYLERRGVPAHPGELADHELIQHTSLGLAAPWTFAGPGGAPLVVEVRARLGINQADAAIAAARDGRGLVRALSYQVAADLEAGRLVRVLRGFEPRALPVNLVWPQSRRGIRRLRLVIDHLAKALGALPAIRPET